MNKQFIITNFAAFALMLFLPTGCRQADGKQDAVQSYRVIKVAASPVEISESYSAAIRGRQDVDILPQISGRIIRLKVKEGERVKTGQVLAVIDQVPYRAALRTAQANVSAAQAKVETARIELRGKQALFDEKVISDYELSLARNQLAVACAELEQAKAQESDARNNLSYTEIKSPSNGVVGTLPYRIGALVGPNMAQPFTVMAAMYKSPPCMDRLALPAIWTALLVMDMVKPESPSARILPTRFLPNTNCFGDSRIIVFLPVRKVNVHKAAINCEITVARAGYYFRERNKPGDTQDRYRDFNGGLKANYTFNTLSNLEVGYTFDQYDKSDYQVLYKNDVRDYSNVQHNVHALYNYTFNEKHTLTVGADYLRDYLMSYQFKIGRAHV